MECPYCKQDSGGNHEQTCPCNQPSSEVVYPDIVTCLWKYDERHDKWDTSCGQAHQLMMDGPSENMYSYCPYCGYPLSLVNTDRKQAGSKARELLEEGAIGDFFRGELQQYYEPEDWIVITEEMIRILKEGIDTVKENNKRIEGE